MIDEDQRNSNLPVIIKKKTVINTPSNLIT